MITKTNAAPAGTGTASKKSVSLLTPSTIRQPGATGCPCGCVTSPSFDDPDCVRHRPIGQPQQWGSYDVTTLGLVPHARDLCAACQEAGK